MSVVNEERNYSLYIHINKLNSKTYVGITSREPEKRWGSNGNGYRKQLLFYNAIQKYDWNIGFEHIILFRNKSKKEAEKLERMLIKILLSNMREFGYNIANGGNTIGKHSEETKLKMSKANIGNKKCLGHKLSENHKHKISEALKGKTIKYKNGNPHCKQIICDNKLFESLSECAKYYNIDRTVMSSWLNGVCTMPEEFYNLGLNYKNYNKIKPKKRIKLTGENSPFAKKVICDNKIFGCIKDCADFYNISAPTMSTWLNGSNKIPKKFYDMGLRYLDGSFTPNDFYIGSSKGSVPVICDDRFFISIKDCSDYYKINPTYIQRWLAKTRPTPQQYIDLGLRYYNPEVDGDIEQYEQYIEAKAM